MLKTKAIFVMTFDDVIVYSSYDLYTYFCRNYSFYSKYLNLYKLYTKKEIYDRPSENVIEFLFNERSFKRLSDKAKKAALSNLYTVMYQNYYNNDVAFNMTETPIANKFLKNPLFFENSGIDKVIIIIKYHTEFEKNSKLEYIKNNYLAEKVETICIPYSDQYYNVISTKVSNWDMLVTDDIGCIEKLAVGDMDHKEIVIPKYGYNIIKPELVELIKQKSGTLSFYELED